MIGRFWAVAAALFAAPSAAQAPGPLQLVDVTPSVVRAWERGAGVAEAERVAAFKAEFAQDLPGFYSHERVRQSQDKYDARLLKGLNDFPAQRAGVERVSREFQAMFTPALSSFEDRFGPMRGYPPVYLVHSFGEFDGGTREIAGRLTLLFGADMIDRYHAGANVQPFFHHELFHLRHARTFEECDQVWCALWAEGLAVLVAAELNPGATDAELLLTQPEPIRPAIERDRRVAVCEVAARLDSTAAEDQAALFSFKRLRPELPPRFGYYVGYLAAAEARRGRTLDELASLDNAAARQAVERSLRRLADCSDPPPPGSPQAPSPETNKTSRATAGR